MGFFSDLKEDLSQAVNELVPEDEKVKGNAVVVKQTAPKQTTPEQTAPKQTEDLTDMLDTMDIDSLLDSKEPVGKTYAAASDETAVVSAGMTIKGDISSLGSMNLIGAITGNIDIQGRLNITGTIEGDSKAAEIFAEKARITGDIHSSGGVQIGQNTIVIGNLFATSAVIAGAVKGDIDVKGPVVLDTSAVIMGNIKSKSVQINNGAVIEGMCSQCYADISPASFFDDIKKVTKKK